MIRKRNGLHFNLDEEIVADGKNLSGDLNIVSHAHFDHMPRKTEKEIICSKETAELIRERTGNQLDYSKEADGIELLPSGHIIGSRSILIRRGEKEILYTGDVNIRDRLYIDGFKPIDADILVIESTYGKSSYTFPDQEELENSIIDWMDENDSCLILSGYSLGKAQKIQKIVKENTSRKIYATEPILKMNQIVEKLTDLEFSAESFSENKASIDEEDVIVKSSSRSSQEVENFKDKNDCLKAGFSGWAINESFRYKGDYDRTFPLSDHCDFNDLVKVVEEVNPEEILTHHGFKEEFASFLRKQKGFKASALKKNQDSLRRYY